MPSIKVRVYCYANEILVLGKASQKQFFGIYKRLVLFLKDRGLNIKEKKNIMEVFLPGAKFEFFGFQFQHLGYSNSKIYLGRYTRYSFSEPCVILKDFHSAQRHNNLIITICPKYYKSIVSKFKLLFLRHCAGFSVKVLIKNYNKWLTKVVQYFGLTRSTKIQLMKLNHLAFLKFKKLLLNKFSSRPKLKTFLRNKYFTSDYLVKDGANIQLKVQDLISNGGRLLCDTIFSIKFFRVNIYLDHSL